MGEEELVTHKPQEAFQELMLLGILVFTGYIWWPLWIAAGIYALFLIGKHFALLKSAYHTLRSLRTKGKDDEKRS